MIGKTLNDFIETLHLGFDMEFVYNNKHYIIGGFCENGRSYIELNECISENICDDSDLNKYYSLVIDGDSFDECVNKILRIKLINNKTLYELEKDITVICG